MTATTRRSQRIYNVNLQSRFKIDFPSILTQDHFTKLITSGRMEKYTKFQDKP